MTISRGFLSKKNEIRSINLIGNLILWILIAYIFYAFFQLFRETFRILSSQLGDKTLVLLTPTENYIYNLFYASIASVLGYLFALRFTLQNYFVGYDWKTRSLIRRTLNMQGLFTWSFLLWFGKLGSLLGVWYITNSLQYDLNLLKSFPLMLLLFPLVLFYSVWPNLSRLIRTKKLKWFLKITSIFLVMSFAFAFKNFLDYNAINKNLLSQSINHVYDLQKPKSQSHERIFRISTVIDIYIVQDTIDTKEPVVFFNNINTKVSFQNIEKAVAREKGQISYWNQESFTANLHIDEDISMEYINPILNELRKGGLLKIQFSTGRKYSRYPADYPGFKYSGIQRNLYPEYYPEFEKFLDSAEQVDLRGKAIKLPESIMYRNGSLKGSNRIEIILTPDSITLNGQKVDTIKLVQSVKWFIEKYSPNYVIIFNWDDKITYGTYIKYLDLLYTQVDRLRNELSNELYNRPFEYQYWNPNHDTIMRRFPRKILEWSVEEQRLNKLLKKAGTDNTSEKK